MCCATTTNDERHDAGRENLTYRQLITYPRQQFASPPQMRRNLQRPALPPLAAARFALHHCFHHSLLLHPGLCV